MVLEGSKLFLKQTKMAQGKAKNDQKVQKYFKKVTEKYPKSFQN